MCGNLLAMIVRALSNPIRVAKVAGRRLCGFFASPRLESLRVQTHVEAVVKQACVSHKLLNANYLGVQRTNQKGWIKEGLHKICIDTMNTKLDEQYPINICLLL